MADNQPGVTNATIEAHTLLVSFATSPAVKEYLRNLERLQRKSEEEGWWNKDLGIAVEDVWGHLKIALERAERR
jgi:hypothetical protein